MDVSKAFANSNMVASHRWGRYKLKQIVNMSHSQTDGRMQRHAGCGKFEEEDTCKSGTSISSGPE